MGWSQPGLDDWHQPPSNGGSLSSLGWYSVKDHTYGAAGDGTTDDTTAIQAACTAAQAAGGGTVYLPGGGGVVYKVTANISVGRNVSIAIGQGATVKATSAITGGIFQWPLTAPFTKDIGVYGPGVIDCNDLAEMGVQLRYYDHVYIAGGLVVKNATKDAIKLGDSGADGNSAEAFVSHVHTTRDQGTLVSASSGIKFENSSDNSISNVICQNTYYGVYVGGNGDNSLIDVHCWSDPVYGDMHDCFYISCSMNKLIACTADTPSTYGYHDTTTNNYYLGCNVYNNSAGTDNVIRGYRFDTASPFSAIFGGQINGTPSHRISVDIEVNGGSFSNLYNLGISVGNCVTTNSGTSHLLALTATGTLQGVRLIRQLLAPTYGATVTPANGSCEWATVTVTDANAFTVAAPSGTLTAAQTQPLTIEIYNNSGGAMGTITWNATYVFTGGAWTNPASTKKRWIRFQWNGTKWVETGRAANDY